MSNQIYVGQEALSLRLNTGIDISAATTVKIKYIKPDGVTTGEWTAAAYSTTYAKKDFEADDGELDTDGWWTFWAWATMADGRDIPGDPVKYRIKTEGT